MYLSNVLSAFDGISCGQIALERAGHQVENYYASEIDGKAIAITQRNYPKTIQVGNIKELDPARLPLIDLLIGGSPCQSLSNAGDGSGFEGKSGLFWEYVRILRALRERNPSLRFLLENVKMRKEWEDIITEAIGVQPIEINSALVSAQNRRRLYWTNIEGVEQPEERGILLKDILERFPPEESYHTDKALDYMNRAVKDGRTHWDFAHHSDTADDKSGCITASFSKGVPYNVLIDRREEVLEARRKLYLSEQEIERAREKYRGKVWASGKRMGNMKFPDDIEKKSRCLPATLIRGARETMHIADEVGIRVLTPLECERLQTLPEDYTAGVTAGHRYKAIGNGWTVEVIAHILKGIK